MVTDSTGVPKRVLDHLKTRSKDTEGEIRWCRQVFIISGDLSSVVCKEKSPRPTPLDRKEIL